MSILLPSSTSRYKQVGALPVRRDANGSLRVLLVTSRETRRWIIPKGWPMKGRADQHAAALEAREEAGVVGTIAKRPIGSFSYWKRRFAQVDLCVVDVYVLDVEKQLKTWRERKQRNCGWYAPEEAAALVREPELAALIRTVADVSGPPASTDIPS